MSKGKKIKKKRVWKPFEKAGLPKEEIDKLVTTVREQYGEEAAKVAEEEMRSSLFFVNNIYQVAVRKAAVPEGFAEIIHLSIKRLDRHPMRDWRDFQRIKNELIGPEYEGVELYPAESRRVDTANQFHLWVFADPKNRFPFGYVTRMVSNDTIEKSKQRPIPEEEQSGISNVEV